MLRQTTLRKKRSKTLMLRRARGLMMQRKMLRELRMLMMLRMPRRRMLRKRRAQRRRRGLRRRRRILRSQVENAEEGPGETKDAEGSMLRVRRARRRLTCRGEGC